MKKIFKLLFLAILLSTFYYCTNDGDNIDKDTTDNSVVSDCSGYRTTCCGISGRYKVIPGKTYTYTATTTIGGPVFIWKVVDGSITLISTYRATATFKFNSDFTTGKIDCMSEQSPSVCESQLDISKQ